MGSKTAALPGKLQNAITERMRLSLLSGDTPFEKARLADAAAFVGALAADRTLGRSSMAIESVSDERRLTRIAIVNDDIEPSAANLGPDILWIVAVPNAILDTLT